MGKDYLVELTCDSCKTMIRPYLPTDATEGWRTFCWQEHKTSGKIAHAGAVLLCPHCIDKLEAFIKELIA